MLCIGSFDMVHLNVSHISCSHIHSDTLFHMSPDLELFSTICA